jgi:hypothetical protein
MANTHVVHIGENSPHQVAYKLLVHIAASEGYHLRHGPTSDPKTPDRKWILDAYADCLAVVHGARL